ncbi:MAG: hypothetical protein AB2A00_33945 [Myxococcota bacterium]
MSTVENPPPPAPISARATPTLAPAPSRVRVGLVGGGAAGVVAAALSLLGLTLIEPELALGTAVPLVATSLAVVLATAAGGMRSGGVSTAMAAGLVALLVVGFPLFVAMEPVWWRFAAGMTAPLLVGAALAYGVPEALEPAHVTVKDAVAAWLNAPWRLMRAIALALLGRDEAPVRR